ncbi:unnamed protein product [Lota lota]
MPLFLNMVFILQLALSSQGPVTPRGTWSKAPAGHGGPRPQQRPRPPSGGQAALARGDACGVYTLGSCTRGLRCLPMGGETRPLQALLEGRGVCSESNPTTRIRSAGNTRCAERLEGQTLVQAADTNAG